MLKKISKLQPYEYLEVSLGCGSKMRIERTAKGFLVSVADKRMFVEADCFVTENPNDDVPLPDGYGNTCNRFVMYISDSAIPTLRALLCGISRGKRVE